MLESIDFPTPVIQLAVEPKTKADQEKLGMAIQKLAQEDPTFKVSTDPETGQTILSGMGELHLEIIVDRMMREFSVGANVGKPQVAYRETIRKHGRSTKYTHKKQTGGSGQYAHVKLRVEPLPPATDFEFENEITGGTIPKEYIKPIEEGVNEALEGGVLAGYPDVGREGDAVSTAAITKSTRRKWRSRSAGSICAQGSVPQGQAGAARAGHGVEVVVPEEYMGVGDRRPEFAARAHRRHGDCAAPRRSSRRWCRCRKCSATPPSCVRARRAAAASRCTSGSTKKCRSVIAEEIVSKVQGKVTQVRILIQEADTYGKRKI